MITALAVTVPLLLVLAQGCGLQGEGQICNMETASTHDGSEDCADGLKCTTVPGASSQICCPEGASDNLNCQAQSNGVGGSASTTTGATTTGATTGTGTSTSSSTASSSSASSSAASSSSASTGTGAGGAGGGP